MNGSATRIPGRCAARSANTGARLFTETGTPAHGRRVAPGSTSRTGDHRLCLCGSLRALAVFGIVSMAWLGLLESAARGGEKDDRAGSTQVSPQALVDHARRELERYFRNQVAEIERTTRERLSAVRSVEDWRAVRARLRTELKDMLGLVDERLFDRKRPLRAVVTGRVTRDGVVVEKLHFQSLPHLYVTANLYRPEKVNGRLPGVLYVCGHGRVKIDGVSYGNKVHYQHHGAWFARHGYVCLAIDTIQLGEIEGIHHGTYRHGMWWWNARGYTPAGVEAFHAMRAIDYLCSRPEVDPDRIGVTGRSGGGAYSWWVTALDDRVKVAVPVAGITSLRNHVVDGCIEGHCDCMYPVNTYRWDFPLVSALAAPRPLLISNTDKDRIFPLDGVVAIYNETRRLYERLGMLKHIGLNIEEGPHRDTQQLRVSAFHWMNRFLRDVDELIRQPAEPLFTPQELKVFAKLPADEINTRIQEQFVPAHSMKLPEDRDTWEDAGRKLRQTLRDHSFGGWPAEEPTGVVHLTQNRQPRQPVRRILPRILPRLRQIPQPKAPPRLLQRTSTQRTLAGTVEEHPETGPAGSDDQKPRIEVQADGGRIQVRVQVGGRPVIANVPRKPGTVILRDVAEAGAEGLRIRLLQVQTQAAVSLPLVWLQRDTDEAGKQEGRGRRKVARGAPAGGLRLVVLDEARWDAARRALRTLLAGKPGPDASAPLWVRDLFGGADRVGGSSNRNGGSARTGGPPKPEGRGAEGWPKTVEQWKRWATDAPSGVALFAPRGIGPTDWGGDERFRTHIRRRFVLLGQTLHGMQVWDIACAMEAARRLAGRDAAPPVVVARGPMAVNTLYAQWMHPVASRLELDGPTATHADGPIYLNVLRHVDVPEAFAHVLTNVPIVLRSRDERLREYLTKAVGRLQLPADRLRWSE